MDQQVVNRSNGKQTLESYQKAYSNELWLTGQESIQGGYADELVQVRCDKSLSGTTQHTTEFLGMQIVYETDNCPINTSPLNVHLAPGSIFSTEYAKSVETQFKSQYTMKLNTPLPMVY